MKQVIKTIGITLLILAIFSFIISIIYQNELTTIMTKEIKIYGIIGMFFVSCLLELIPQYIAPQLFAFNAAILGFSFWKTVLALYLGSVVGSVIGFEIGRHYKEFSFKMLDKNKTNKIKKYIKRWGKLIIFLTAISPLPYLPILFGFLHVKRKIFLLLGVLPRFLYFFLIAVAAFYIF
jgi:membrane protein YqaA with SNARE-associated domain